ncbi:MAG TPA: hypothetical protein VJ854_07065 [Sphaerochaeta sp.]|nr:hypothetical protein [Sphaerochaeta sp.]
MSIQIRPASETIRAIRYQSGALPNKAWQSAPLSVSTLELKGFASETEFLFVQQSEDGNTWSELYAYQYDKQNKSWSVAAFPPKGFVRFNINASDETNRMIRYQYGRQPTQAWRIADSSTPIIIEAFDSGKEFLFVQQAVTEEVWSDTYAYQYDYLQEGWSLVAFEQEKEKISTTSLDVKGYGLLPIGNSSDFYSYLLGGGVQANISLGKMIGYTGITFSKGPPKSAWVRSQQALALAIGMGYEIPLSDRVSLIPEVGYGVILHLLDADFNKDGAYKAEFFIDQQVRLSLYLTYALNGGNKLFIAPLGVLFFEKEDFGIMYGCQAGLRISL